MKNISILGSTGSIGTQTLDIVRNNLDLNVVAIAGNSNVELLRQQIEEFSPDIVCVYQEEKAEELRAYYKDYEVKIVSGMDGLIEAATWDSADIVLTAVVGMIGIQPTIAAIKARKTIALANKETLVCAGHIIMPLSREMGVKILPVDSEHSAIFQSLNGENPRQLEKILLTASGGPFRGWTREQMKNVKLADALNHPNWSMGKKITIDSATMVNKGLEVIEAKWLFNVPYDKIQIVVQPQSLIHSMVQFVDGGIMAQLGTPDMKLPIQYALFYPDRREMDGERVDFGKIAEITFEDPDFENFKGLALALRAAKEGGSLPTVFNAANEYAVARFLKEEISFLDITEMIEYAMNNHEFIPNPTVEEILKIEQDTRKLLEERF
ncbi:MAG: 1-deoxy-D-xylulose-5-phosphate reductoisomerase [Lachnospiraceae bacterium]|nr:1-deoxy-D-xylulose-5-phosphate reductoisomerase [Lachnospiraceae bacterium]